MHLREFSVKSNFNAFRAGKVLSVFKKRTEDSSAMQYFQFYGYLSQQQNMMQDFVRTSTYQKAIMSNIADFQDKVVLDVGAGSGILSFFAQQAGARRVSSKRFILLISEASTADRLFCCLFRCTRSRARALPSTQTDSSEATTLIA